jgi:hypothetical protein
MGSEFKITCLCLFCQAPLVSEEDAVFKSGDLIKCKLCGEGNDYDSVIKLAKEKGIEKVTSDLKANLKKTFKNFK